MESEKIYNGSGMKSLWEYYPSTTTFPSLSGDETFDVAVIGGGITGITTAQLLKEAGFSVAILEAYDVGQGSTGHSTGNLYTAIEEGFDTIKSKYDTEALRTLINGRKTAIDLVEQNVNRFNIDCDFKRVPWYSYSVNLVNNPKLEKIRKAGVDAGADVVEVTSDELPFEYKKAIKLENQAQFNPLRYVQQLAAAIADEKCKIYENSRVTLVTEDEEGVAVKTTGGRIRAKYAIHATHTPKGLMPVFHSLLGTYREYGIAARLNSDADYPEGTFWGYYRLNERFSVRSYSHEGQKHVVVVGQPHEVGQKSNNQENIDKIEQFLHEHFDVAEITNRWGGQNYKPADGLPYIGRRGADSPILIATGFSTDGLTYGTMSAILLRDILTGNENDLTRLFDATRKNPMKAAGKFLKENTINAAQIINDYVLFKDGKLSEIKNGEAKVIEVDGKKVAVYKENSGEVKACSAVCTHMGCVVHWNGAEKTWDCPCHASRFTTDGHIIEGPALTPLQKVDVK